MKIIFSIFFALCFFHSFSQSFSEDDISKIAKDVNNQLQGKEHNGMVIRGCISIGRTLIFEYDTSDYWYPPENMKEDILENFKQTSTAEVYFNNDVNVDFYYYSGNKIIKKISIKSKELSNLNFSLGDYISINGHPKAKGVNLKIKQPIGWEVKEGDRPNIVKKFVYKNQMFMIMVKDYMTFFSRKEMRELLDDDEYVNELINGMVSYMQNPKILNHSIVTIGSYPAIVCTFKGNIERLGVKMTMANKIWIIFYEDKIISLQAGGLEGKEFNTLQGLYSSITNSVIFPEQYN